MNSKKWFYKLGLTKDGEVVPGKNVSLKGIINVESGFLVRTPDGVIPPGGKLNTGNATFGDNQKVTNFEEFQRWVQEGGRNAEKYQIEPVDDKPGGEAVGFSGKAPTKAYSKTDTSAKVALERSIDAALDSRRGGIDLDKNNLTDVLNFIGRVHQGILFKVQNPEAQQDLMNHATNYIINKVGASLIEEHQIKEFDEQQNSVKDLVDEHESPKPDEDQLEQEEVEDVVYPESTEKLIEELEKRKVEKSENKKVREKIDKALNIVKNTPALSTEKKDGIYFGLVVKEGSEEAPIEDKIKEIRVQDGTVYSVFGVTGNLDLSNYRVDVLDVSGNKIDAKVFDGTSEGKLEKGASVLRGLNGSLNLAEKVFPGFIDYVSKFKVKNEFPIFEKTSDGDYLFSRKMLNQGINSVLDDVVDFVMIQLDEDLHNKVTKSSIFKVVDFAPAYFPDKKAAEARSLFYSQKNVADNLKNRLQEAVRKKFSFDDGEERSLEDVLALENDIDRKRLYKEYVKHLGSFISDDNTEFQGLSSDGVRGIYKEMHKKLKKSENEKKFTKQKYPPDEDIDSSIVQQYYSTRDSVYLNMAYLSSMTSGVDFDKSIVQRRNQMSTFIHSFNGYDEPRKLLSMATYAVFDCGFNVSESEEGVSFKISDDMKSFLENTFNLNEDPSYVSLNEKDKVFKLLSLYEENSPGLEIDSHVALSSRLESTGSSVGLNLSGSQGQELPVNVSDSLQKVSDGSGELEYNYGKEMASSNSSAVIDEIRKEPGNKDLEALELVQIARDRATEKYVDTLISSGDLPEQYRSLAIKYLEKPISKGTKTRESDDSQDAKVGYFTEDVTDLRLALSLSESSGGSFVLNEDKNLEVRYDGGTYEILKSDKNYGFGDTTLTHVDNDGNVSLVVLEQKATATSTSPVFHLKEVMPFKRLLDNIAEKYGVSEVTISNTHQISYVNEGSDVLIIDTVDFSVDDEGNPSNSSGFGMRAKNSKVILSKTKR